MKRIRVLDNCVTELSRLPGIGKKTATRLAMHLLKAKKEDVVRLAESIKIFKNNAIFCKICGGLSEDEVCSICSDQIRANGLICVVEDIKDLFTIEQTGYFNGRYHVLGGKISPLDGVGPDDLKVKELIQRVKSEEIKEVILATNPDIDGETTALYVAKLLKDLGGVAVTKLASGIPLGSHIEYADELTVLRAIEGRREF